MKNFKLLFSKPLRAVPISIVIFILVLSLIGFVDSAYLAVEHFQGRIPPCSIIAGCDTVLTSTYAVIGGIPVALAGAIYYFLVMLGAFAYFESGRAAFLKWALLLTIPGFILSLWFTYIQVFVLYSYCAYCLGSAATSTFLFATAMDVFARYQVRDHTS